jgi:tol-pal system protein YbgF
MSLGFMRLFKPILPAAVLAAGLAAAHAQERDTSFFGQIFGGSERFGGGEAPVQTAQVSPSELVVRLDRLENQVRQLTGLVEQLQYRNQQLEQQLRRFDAGGPPPAQGRPPAPPPPLPQRQSDLQEPQDYPYVPGAPRSAPGRPDAVDSNERPNMHGAPRSVQRRGDVFDPAENPGAPGAPRVLGSLPAGPTIVTADPEPPAPPIGAPGGRQAGAPLDLSTLSARVVQDPSLAPAGGQPPPMTGALPAPPPRNPSATGAPQQHATLPPTSTPKDEYDLAYGYLVRKDYALAEEGFRGFLRKYPSERLAGEANYWLGESLFQRQRYRDAAESFLNVSTKFDKSTKAPEALLRLGQSLAALKEKEAACATFSELGRKYPRASPSVKQGVEREQKRAGC